MGGMNAGAPGAPQPGMAQQAMGAMQKRFDIDPRVIEALVGMARGDIMRLMDIAREAERLGTLPQGVCNLFDFLKGLITKDEKYIEALLGMLQTFCGMD